MATAQTRTEQTIGVAIETPYVIADKNWEKRTLDKALMAVVLSLHQNDES
jgi:hypothetical protein